MHLRQSGSDTSESSDDDNSDEQLTGEIDEERIETELITLDSDLLELVNNFFTMYMV